jgi:hypothetical protein
MDPRPNDLSMQSGQTAEFMVIVAAIVQWHDARGNEPGHWLDSEVLRSEEQERSGDANRSGGLVSEADLEEADRAYAVLVDRGILERTTEAATINVRNRLDEDVIRPRYRHIQPGNVANTRSV